MILIQTDNYSIRQDKMGFLNFHDKNGKKVKRLGHRLFLNNLKKCDENNFIIAFAKMNFTFEHYNLDEVVTAFKTSSPTRSFACTFELSDDVLGVMANSKYGCSYVLYNWQTKNYYKCSGEMPTLNQNKQIVISKMIKYDDEVKGLYFVDNLKYKINPETFEIKEAYSTLQQRNINFAKQDVKEVLNRECLENMKTLALLQKEGLLKSREENVLKKTLH